MLAVYTLLITFNHTMYDGEPSVVKTCRTVSECATFCSTPSCKAAAFIREGDTLTCKLYNEFEEGHTSFMDNSFLMVKERTDATTAQEVKTTSSDETTTASQSTTNTSDSHPTSQPETPPSSAGSTDATTVQEVETTPPEEHERSTQRVTLLSDETTTASQSTTHTCNSHPVSGIIAHSLEIYRRCVSRQMNKTLCDNGSVISIQHADFADYGFLDKQLCNDDNPPLSDVCLESVNEKSSAYYNFILKKCNGYQACQNLQAAYSDTGCSSIQDDKTDWLVLYYTCIEEVNECCSSPCQNGGTCVDLVYSYACTCAPGYEGVNCETGE